MCIFASHTISHQRKYHRAQQVLKIEIQSTALTDTERLCSSSKSHGSGRREAGWWRGGGSPEPGPCGSPDGHGLRLAASPVHHEADEAVHRLSRLRLLHALRHDVPVQGVSWNLSVSQVISQICQIVIVRIWIILPNKLKF